MSSYFDAIDSRIRDCEEGYGQMAQIEGDLVRDVTVCAVFPEFEPLRNAIQETILRYGIYSLPEGAYQADFETLNDHKRRLYRLNYDLHTIFHDAARMGLSDSPLFPLQRLASAGEADRENRVRQMPAFACACGNSWGSPDNNLLCLRCGQQGEAQGKTLEQFCEDRGDNIPAWECACGEHWSSPSDLCACGKTGWFMGTMRNVRKDGNTYPFRGANG